MKIFISAVLICVLLPLSALAQAEKTDSLYLDGYSLGTTLRSFEAADLLTLDFPVMEAQIPLYAPVLNFKYGGHLLWGLNHFFVEWNYAAGLYLYPAGKYFSMHSTAQIGTFFFDNISLTAAAGLNLYLPLRQDMTLALGVEYFYRVSGHMIDYVSFPVVSGSNVESINMDSRGTPVSIAIKF